MENKYKLYKGSLKGFVSKVESYVFDDHPDSVRNAAIGMVSTAVSLGSIPQYIGELNGTVPYDPASPMFIPAVGGAIMAFGFFAAAIKKRVDENRELREEYAQEYARQLLKEEQLRAEEERLRANRNDCFINFLTNPYAEDGEEIDKPRIR